MPTTRVMSGLADMTGQRFGTLLVQRMVSRQPEPKYAVVCERCNTTSTPTHSRLRNGAATCQYSACGKPSTQRSRDLLSEQRRQIAEHESQRRADELAASAARMEAETEDWERPTKYAPTPEQPVMSERERISIRERRDAEDAERLAVEAERLDAERKANEAWEAIEAEQRKRTEGQRQYWREWVETDRDPKLYVTPELRTASMPTNKVSAHNSAEVEKFIQATPEFIEYKTPQNANELLAYFDRNGVRIFDAAMLQAAFVRLRDLGILEKRPVPQSEPVEQPRRVNLTISSAPAKPVRKPDTYIGRDYATGKERTFTRREVDRMSSAEYARAFEVLPTVSELFTRMSDTR